MRILIVSSDKLAHLLPMTIASLRMNWKACPYDIHVLGVTKPTSRDVDVPVHLVGKDKQYASNLLWYLNKDDTDPDGLILLWLDDHYLRSADASFIRDCEQLIRTKTIPYVRLVQRFTPSQFPLYAKDERFRVIPHRAGYSMSLQASIWRKEALLQILVPGENAWETELYGSIRAYRAWYGYRQLLGVAVPGIDYVNLHSRGEINAKAYARCLEEMQNWKLGGA